MSAPLDSVCGTLGVKERTLLWRTCDSAPCGLVRPHLVQQGQYLYMGGGLGASLTKIRTVYRYSLADNTWGALPITPCHTFGLTVVDDMVTLVGGVNIITSQPSNQLLSFRGDVGVKGMWCTMLPSMPTARSCCTVIKAKGHVFVTGGVVLESRSYAKVVEVYNVHSKTWYSTPAMSLPLDLAFMCGNASADRLYLSGGLSSSGAVTQVYSCSIDALIAAAKADADAAAPSVWEVIANTPYVRSGNCVLQDHFLVFCGILEGERDETQNGVFALNKDTKEWTRLGDAPSRRSSVSAVVTGSSRVMIVGGYTQPHNWTNSIVRDVVEVLNIPL